MKNMLLGIFLLLLAIWSLIFGISDNLPILCWIGLILPVPALIAFIMGYSEKKP